MHMPPYPQPLPQEGGGLWCNLPVLWATLNQCGNNWLKQIRSRHFFKWLWASQTSENFFHKTKVVPFEKLILNSANKTKFFWPSYDPFKEVCFFNFPSFTDFERPVTLLLVKIILNFKNSKKAVSKLFLNSLINFYFKEVFMPKTPCECEYCARFLPRLCVATENIWGGGVRWTIE